LKTYFKSWKEFCNENDSLAENINAIKQIKFLLQPQPDLFKPVPALEPNSLQNALSASASASNTSSDVFDSWTVRKLLTDLALQQFSIQYQYSQNPTAAVAVQPPKPGPASSKRKLADQSTTESSKRNKPRQPRKCTYCKSTECKGRWQVEKCELKSLDNN
jgi:hypothetical protein